MLGTTRITIEAKTVIDGKEIHGHRAILAEDGVTLLPYQIDKQACKDHRKTVRKDAEAFEDYSYNVHDTLFAEQGDK